MNKSYLMVAGDKINHLNKINKLKCDVAIVNLEDGVFDKEIARKNILDYFQNNKVNKYIVVRINSLDTCAKEDIDIVNIIKPNAIRIPKINNIEDIKICLELIDEDIDIHLSIETKDALKNLQYFNIDKRVTTVYLGILDMLESLGLQQEILTFDNPSIDYILSKFLIDSKIANLHPVSFIYQDYENLKEFTLWCNKIKLMGYESKACISLKQVDIVNEIFNINNKQIQKAKYIKKVFEENNKNKISGFKDEKYGFIDEPIYKNSIKILSKIMK